MFDFLSIKKSVDILTGRVLDVRKKSEQLKQRRDVLSVAPPTKADVIGLLHQRIDQMAAQYPDLVRKSLGTYLNDSVNELLLPHHSLAFLMPASANYIGVNTGAIFEGLAFLLNEPFKAGVARAIEAMEWPEDAIPMADRMKELSRLDKEIAALSKEEDELQQHAAEAGITINI